MVSLSDNGDGTFEFKTPYNYEAKEALKRAIPAPSRRWDGGVKSWFVSPAYGSACVKIALDYYGANIGIPNSEAVCRAVQNMTFRMVYLGTVKERQDGFKTAYGWVNDWDLLFPLDVLRDWFGGVSTKATTYYNVLGVANDVPGILIRKAFRRAARTWHPDICREPGATEQFKLINEANRVLSDPLQRRQYDAGIAMGLLNNQVRGTFEQSGDIWRPPVRCGNLALEVLISLGTTRAKYQVQKILDWTDITNSRGRVLVTYWRGDSFREEWT